MTVTAHYTGTDDTEDVTNKAEFNGYNMNTVGNQTVTVSYTEGGETKSTTYDITVNAGTKYTVTFNAEAGTCATAALTETEYLGGVTLPSATISINGWEFAGWATDAISSTSTRPTLYLAGSTFYPTSNTTLHAVYTPEDAVNKYQLATSNSDIVNGANVVISSLGTNKYTLGNNNGSLANITNFTPEDGIITCANSQAVWTLNIADGKIELSNNGKYLKRNSGTLSIADESSKWTISKASYGENRFLIKDYDTNYYLRNNGSWGVNNTSSITESNVNNTYGLTIYVAMPTLYNSNPTTAVVEPSVAFNSSATHTLYLDGTTTYTNTASVTGIDKAVTYTSSNEAVATVNASGVVTAVGIGTATIKAKVAAEVGVNKAASDTYDVVVKSTTTIAGIKELGTSSTAVNFSADLTDAVVTYANGEYAYIQDASAAIMVNFSGHGLTAGKKINGAVSGQVKAPNQIDQLSTFNITSATVTEDGVIPAAEVKTLAQIKAAGTAYDGKMVTVNAATVVTGMNNAASGGVITDDGETTTFNIIAPNFMTLKATEIGNFTGFVSIYNGSAYRLNLYETSQFVKTQNVATAQTLTFDEDEIELSEETAELTAFAGQTVNGAHTTVTYAVDESSDDIVASIDAATGEVTLNGACGTAIITASAVAANIVEDGVTTPYTAANASYYITVSPRYTVTFSINGVENTMRQSAAGAAIAVPTPDAIDGHDFVGWSIIEVDATDDEPEMENLGATITPESNGDVYYAVFATATVSGSGGSYTLDYTNESGLNSQTLAYATETTYTANDGGVWVIHAYCSNTGGLQINTNKGASIKVPSCPSNITTIEITSKTGAVKAVGFSATANGSSVATGTDGTSQTLDLTGKNMKDGYVIPVGGNNIVTKIIVNYGPTTSYSDYRTSLSNVDVTIGDSKYATFCYGRALDFSASDVKAYTAKVESGKVVLSKVANDVVPANTGVVLYCETADTYTIPVTTTDATVSDNEMVGVTEATAVEWHVDTKYNYILQSGAFNMANGGKLRANRAYLSTAYDVTAASGARSLMMVFDDETTGIGASLMNSEKANGEVYNLNGQRVMNPAKGLYIVNGRKVVVK